MNARSIQQLELLYHYLPKEISHFSTEIPPACVMKLQGSSSKERMHVPVRRPGLNGGAKLTVGQGEQGWPADSRVPTE